MTAVGVLGAGSWGTTLADHLARSGHRVRLWAFEAAVADAINRDHLNPVFLPDRPLDPGIVATSNPLEAIEGAESILVVSPSHVTRQLLNRIAAAVAPGMLVVSATKGIETDSLQLMHQVAAATLGPHRFVALSGPSFALELKAGQPTAVVAASTDPDAAAEAQRLFSHGPLRVYSNPDVVGTELGGALKNVIAIAAGIGEGLGLGNNPRAALVTRGLAEMVRLGLALGADRETFAGLAGLGDLILTTGGALSRNRSLGEALAKGATLAEYQHRHQSVAEGVNTARAAVRLAARYDVEMPITEKVHEILFGGLAVKRAIAELMERAPKPEQWT